VRLLKTLAERDAARAELASAKWQSGSYRGALLICEERLERARAEVAELKAKAALHRHECDVWSKERAELKAERKGLKAEVAALQLHSGWRLAEGLRLEHAELVAAVQLAHGALTDAKAGFELELPGQWPALHDAAIAATAKWVKP
jgi:chromosome segregation ATPase